MESTLSHDRFISHHRVQKNPEDNPKSTLTFAYGEWRYPKFCEQLQGDDSILRTKILKEVNEDFHRSDTIDKALKNSTILTELLKCFKESDVIIRELASRAVQQIAKTEIGKHILIEGKKVMDLAALFNDKEVSIRHNAYTAILNLSEYMDGIDSVIEFGIITILVDKLVAEKDEHILELILELLNILLEGGKGPSIVLDTPVLGRLNDHLKSKNPRIRELAAINLGSISYNEKGKQATIDAQSIPPLCELLNDSESRVRTAATRALVSLAQLKAGKVQIHDLEAVGRIIELLKDESEQTRIFVVQLISSVAEYPPCRFKFKACLSKLEELKSQTEYPLVSRFAGVAIDVITWLP